MAGFAADEYQALNRQMGEGQFVCAAAAVQVLNQLFQRLAADGLDLGAIRAGTGAEFNAQGAGVLEADGQGVGDGGG